MKQEKYDVRGMSCSACSAAVTRAVQKVGGVASVQVNLLTNSMQVEYEPQQCGEREIIKAVEQAGYQAAVHGTQQSGQPAAAQNTPAEPEENMKIRLGVSLCFLAVLMYVSMGGMAGLPMPAFLKGHQNAAVAGVIQLLLTLPVLSLNRAFFTSGLRALRHRSPNMDSLVAVGSGAAFAYSTYALLRICAALGAGDMETVAAYHMDLYFESSAMILTLITIGKALEKRAKGKTSDAIRRLMDLSPKTALRQTENGEETIPAEQVQVGDVLVVKQGMAVAADGILLSGAGSVDEAALTGESLPVEKHEGDAVTGATICKNGYFTMRATRVGEDTALAGIIRLVEDATGSKAPIAKLADRVSGVFVPVVMGIALAATIIWLLVGKPFAFALSIGVAVLVISCPCALGLATPTAIMVGMGVGAKKGVLFKTAEGLQQLSQVQTVVLDKTGTVTEGTPQVTDVYLLPGVEEPRFWQLVGGLERRSGHPLSAAVAERAGNTELEPQEFEAVPGRGVKGRFQERWLLGGNAAMMQENGVELNEVRQRAEQWAEQGKTALYFALEGRLLGVIAVADVIKPSSPEAIRRLKALGLSVVLLTGDHEQTAKAIAAQVGIDRVVAQVLPQEKEEHVRTLQQQGQKTAMVGDGINDAPALARSDVGIAIGAGTDVAMESADVVLMKSDLTDVATAVELSRSVIRNIKENLFWAFFYNSIGIPLAAGVFYTALNWKLSPMFGAAAMSLSSFCVVSNALRLRGFHSRFADKNQPKQTGKEEKQMKKVIAIDGMMCSHCTGRVQQALSAIEGAQVQVSLEGKNAVVITKEPVSDERLKQIVTDAGYEVTGITGEQA